jgi:DNA processing protein
LTACDACLRRTALLEMLGPWFEFDRGEGRRTPLALALPDDELVARVCGLKRGAVDARRARFDASAARRRAAAGGMRILCRHSPEYPYQLSQAPDAPAALHLIGDPEVLSRCTAVGAVAIVGSRKASRYGLEMAHALARDLAAWGVTVVSGLAYGIDSAAHEGALPVGGPTIAVMAGGADVATPPSKHRLHAQMKGAGLVLSEMPPGMRPFRWSFPARNRIMAALSRMTVVVEGAEGSGSLITAGFAQDLGRDVGAVPGLATSAVAAGPNRLLADGAIVVRSARDILDALYGPGKGPPGAVAPAAGAASGSALDPQLRRLLERIEGGIVTVDGLAEEADLADVLAGLSELELLGLVARGPGGDYARRA